MMKDARAAFGNRPSAACQTDSTSSGNGLTTLGIDHRVLHAEAPDFTDGSVFTAQNPVYVG
jgi:hypothetical protein